MAFTISYKFLAHDSFTRVSDKMAQSFAKVERNMKRVQSQAVRLTESFKGIRDAGLSAFTQFTLPIVGMGAFAARSAAQLESLNITFESALQSAERAKMMVADLTDFAAKTPFRLTGVMNSGRMLLGFGVQAENVRGKLEAIGDVASGVDRPINELTYIFGQVKAKGRLMQDSLNQFAERGIPILSTLAKGTGKTTQEIQDLASKGAISFELFEKAFMQMRTDMYLNNTEKLSQSLGGLWSTLLDNISITSGKIFMTMDEMFDFKGKLTAIIASIETLANRFDRFVEVNPRMAKFLFILTGIVAIVPVLLVVIGSLTFVFSFLAKAAATVAAVFALMSLKILLIIAAIGLVVYAGYKLYKHWDELVIAAEMFAIKVYNTLSEWFTKLGNFLKSFAQGWFKIMFAPVIAAYDGFIALMEGRYGDIMNAICKPFKDAKDIIMGVFDSVLGVITSVFNKVESLYNRFSAGPKAKIEITDATQRIASPTLVQLPKNVVQPNIELKPSAIPTQSNLEFRNAGNGQLGAKELSSKSVSDVNINLNAPKDTVKDVSTKTKGFSNMNLGFNMVGDY